MHICTHMLLRFEVYVAEATAREGWHIRVCALACLAAKLLPLYSRPVLSVCWAGNVYIGVVGTVSSCMSTWYSHGIVHGSAFPLWGLGGSFTYCWSAASGCQHWLWVRVVVA